ncbi:hypothetical protein O181_069831 [Austropuccinia psidii MF-1]|uniref:GAG-pre-integrase domain-containing protein n=1 Tax=Austropuccinia psidii MF-1 TaxID=1389203 RepID=A0A9Q3EXJ0_9BASI|nr:hypothetical protein [Austropuccinia psidii MF-1]
MGQLAEDGIEFLFLGNKLFLHHHSILFPCFFHHFRWFLPVIPTLSAYASVSIKPISINNTPPINLATKLDNGSEGTGELWNCRLGHLSIRNIKRLTKYQAAEGLPSAPLTTNNICHQCLISKSEHWPISTLSRQHILKPGNLIVADLIGPLPPSYDDKKYVLIIQDFFSCLAAAIPIQDKSEAKTHFIDWMKRFSNATTHSITHETSIPYEYHQNGRVEQTNCSILEIARTSLLSANISKRLWPFAFKHAALIFNRVIHADSTKTPYESVSGLKPTLVLLQVFGAKSYIFNPLQQKDLGQRGMVGYHMGLAPYSKAWIFWLPDKGDFFMKSASVRFNEKVSFTTEHVSSIQASDIFDDSMILKIENQDTLIASLNTHSDSFTITPTTFEDVTVSLQKDHWVAAINDELKSMKDEDVFEVIDLKDALRNQKLSDILST